MFYLKIQNLKSSIKLAVVMICALLLVCLKEKKLYVQGLINYFRSLEQSHLSTLQDKGFQIACKVGRVL